MTEQQTLTYSIERPEPVVLPPTKINVLYQDSVISFAHPFFGPDTYRETGNGVLEAKNAKLSLPTGEQMAYLLHGAYLGDEEFRTQDETTGIRDRVMKNNWFWIFNRNLWTDEGVYVVWDPKAVGLSQALNQGELERSLEDSNVLSNGVKFSEDKSIVFAPKDAYKLGDHTPESFAKDGFVIATFGEVGAEKLEEVSKELRNNPKTWGLEIKKGQDPQQRLSAVYGYDGRLDLGGGYHDYGNDGYASGVF